MAELQMKQTEFQDISIKTHAKVYEPREDSFLLAEAVAKNSAGDFLEMGTGTGLTAIAAAKNSAVNSVTAADINPYALALAKENAANNGVSKERIKFIKSNLFSSLGSSKFDCIAFNPPYLPAEEDSTEKFLRNSWEGGKNGRLVLDRFLAGVGRYLKPKGVLLLLNSSLSSSEEVEDGNKETLDRLHKLGFATQVVAKQDFFFEHLIVIKATKTTARKARKK